MSRLFKPVKIIEIDGMKILFIGIVTEAVLSNAKNEGLIGTFVDINEAATEVGHICNTYNSIDIDYTVLLTHIGFEEDKKLAELLDPNWGVDVIIGGHSHTLIEEPAIVNDILIVQAGVGTDQIGRFDLEIDTLKNCTRKWEWKCIPINDKTCPKDEKLEELINNYKNQTDLKYGRVITRFKRELTHPDRYRETELGDLFADILKKSLGVDIMLLGSGSIRNEKLEPIVTLQDLNETFPYDDSIHMLTITGKMLKKMILYMLRDEAFEGDHTEFYQFSEGLFARYSRSEKKLLEFSLDGKPIKPSDEFKVGLQKYHFINIEECFNVTLKDVEELAKVRIIATSCRDVIEESLSNCQQLDVTELNRLIIDK